MKIAPEIEAAYRHQERVNGASRLKVGCLLVLTLLPAGALVDYFVYPDHFRTFLLIRGGFALTTLPLLYLFNRPAGVKYYNILSLLVAVIPAAAICTMIRLLPNPAASPYYATINLILLAIALVAQWDRRQSLVGVILLLAMYLGAVAWPDARSVGIFVNNLWFMALTGIIVVVGSEMSDRLRLRDYASSAELAESQRRLEQSYKQLQQLDELKGRFFANISHELRTPLTLILAPLETLLKGDRIQDPETLKLLQAMQDNGMRLLKLINDLLDLVRLDAGRLRLHRRPIEANAFIGGILNATSALAKNRGIRQINEVPADLPTLYADPDKLEKIFLNLVFNAIKFTPAGGRVTIRAKQEDGAILFAVEDTGMGIAPEHLPHLFSRFWQADTEANRKFQGAGIGLALVRELVRAHEGEVKARSTPGKGTTMLVRLPLGSPDQASEPVERPSPEEAPETADTEELSPRDQWLRSLYRRAELYARVTPLRRTTVNVSIPSHKKLPTVLVVDDEPDMLQFLEQQLSDEYHVIEATDGDQAITLARQFLPDVIICDFMLPEQDGLAVCEALRKQVSTRSLPLLMLTARADDATKLKALELGVNDFLAKPFSVAELKARVRGLCENHRLQRQLAENNRKLEGTLEQLKETELQLVQAEKMASLGRLSAGIIHEINNPLNFALTALRYLNRAAAKLAEEDREEFEDTLKDIQDGLRRVSVIIGDLRSFTHPHSGELVEVNLRETVEAALRFLTAEWKDKVDVQLEIPDDLTVWAAGNRLVQVFLNLFQNSLDALKSQAEPHDPPVLRVAAREADGERIVTVWDNGPGIPEHHLARIFDPFFTTKEVGKGTGLGLSICYRLLNEFGARITVRSEPGKFTEFTLVFPSKRLENQQHSQQPETPEVQTLPNP
ncbi:MAG: response regulator [Verrucomicrobia bacterium]|nr:MAG: response regulator [Verrucomicrobiota bacterium]